MVTVLFPGRHHILTKFQYSFLRGIIDQGINGQKVDRIIFAITSSDHENTRRNPIPLYLRTLEIDKFSRDFPCEVKIYTIPDVRATDNNPARTSFGRLYTDSIGGRNTDYVKIDDEIIHKEDLKYKLRGDDKNASTPNKCKNFVIINHCYSDFKNLDEKLCITRILQSQ